MSFVICHLSVLKTHLSLTHPVAQVMFFLRGVGIKIESGCLQKGVFDFEKGALIPFRTMNYHGDKIYNRVAPTKISLHKNMKGLKVFLWISCICS